MKKHGSLNHIYRLVWSRVLKAWVAVGENTRGCGKGKNSRNKLVAAALALAGGAVVIPPAQAGPSAVSISPSITALSPSNTLPTGYQVTAGSVVVGQSGNTLNVQENSQRAAINWQTFSIGSGATVNFVQPNNSAVILNRIVGNETSVISGALIANGQVFLLNSNGVLLTKGASINTGGLVASTLNISDSDFMAGRDTFTTSGSHASVINQGTINAADGGYVALMGNRVVNQGLITARLGTAILAAGDQVSLNFNGNSLVNVVINKGTLDALVSNQQAIYADGGLVVLTAKAADTVLASAVNNTGEIRAQTIANQSGKIYLLGDMQNGSVNVGGTLDASAPNGGSGGNIETSAEQVKIANGAIITTAASAGLSGSWLIDPTDFTIAASGGNITGAQLSTNLGSNATVTLQSSDGTAGTGGNINVNDNVSWNANTLILTAANNVNVNAQMTATGSASLQLNPATANGTASAVTTGTVLVGLNNSGFTGAVNFSGSGSLSINGNTYTVINDAVALQAIATGNLGGYYALGSSFSAGGISNFSPIGQYQYPAVNAPFTGVFDGLGHTVSNLTINYPATNSSNSYLGFFGYLTGTVRNVGLTNESLTVTGGSANEISNVGGLVGVSQYGFISNTYTTGAVTINSTESNPNFVSQIGGLVGYLFGGSLNNSYSNSSVSAPIFNMVGGLVGNVIQRASVNNSYATGSVTGLTNVGGLLGGLSESSATNTYASGPVNGNNYVGGLIGSTESGTVNASFATGAVTASGALSGSRSAGGLIGSSGYRTVINNSFAQGSVTSSGAITGNSYVGGLVGFSYGNTITNSYATGAVQVTGVISGTNNIGGLVGFSYGASYGVFNAVSHSFYNSTINASIPGVGGLTAVQTGVTGMSTAQMQTQATYSGASWDFTTPVWKIFPSVNGGYPCLAWSAACFSNSTPIYLDPLSGASVYGTTPVINYVYDTSPIYADGSVIANATVAAIGSVAWTGAPVPTSGVNSYTITPNISGISSVNSAYSLFAGNGVSWTVSPALLAITASNASKVYGQTPTLTAFTSSGLVNGETVGSVTETSSGTVATAGVVGGPYAIVPSAATGGTFSAANYTISYINGSLTVNPLAVMISTVSGASRSYDGTSNAASNLLTITNLINGDSVTLSGSGSLAGSSAGNETLAGVSGLSLNNPNYTLTGGVPSGSVLIAPATLDITASNASKVYGQTPTLTAFTSSGLVNGETVGSVTETSSGAVATAGVVGGPYAIVPGAAVGGTFNAVNYTITYLDGSLTVTPLAVSVVAVSGANRVYDGTANAAANLLTITNIINGDTVALSGSATLAGSGVGSEALIGLSGLSLNNPNYTLTGGVPDGAVTITAAAAPPVTPITTSPNFDDAIAAAEIQGEAINYLSGYAMTSSRPASVIDQPAGFVNVVNPLPQINTMFGEGAQLAIISSPTETEPSQVVSMSQARAMLQASSNSSANNTDNSSDAAGDGSSPTDVRVPVSRNSLAEIVNGGVRLPTGVEQQLFVVKGQ